LKKLILNSPAKLNLHLQVLDKRQDGFHNISSCFVIIDFYDELRFNLLDKEIKLKEAKPIGDNIILKAVDILQKHTNTHKGIEIELIKNIPMQGGMGGGSSNAATALVGLNRIWNLNLSKEQLLHIGLELGSDVPFFVNGHSSWVEGRGEVLSSIELDESWFILFFPSVNIGTEFAFKNLKETTKTVISKADFLAGKRINSFFKWAKDTYPEIKNLTQVLEKYGDPLLTGTGSTIFFPCNSKSHAEEVLLKFPKGFLVKSLDDSPLLQVLE
jgi:4-diphosphocytidyl-2-C-methyl-D-erythritol kinase